MPKRTFQPKNIRRLRKHGFRSRKMAGGAILKARRQRGRKSLAAEATCHFRRN